MDLRDMKDVILEQAKKYDSFYLYEERGIAEYTGRLKKSFPRTEFLYSIKCNSNPEVVKCVFSQGFGADAASLGEVRMARKWGLEKEHIFYSAPGKSMEDIRQSISECTLIADSVGEVQRIWSVAEELGISVNIGIRINPEFSFYDGNSHPSKFGIDEAQVYELFSRGDGDGRVRITGIHVHLRSQELNGDVLAGYYENMIALAKRVQAAAGSPLEYINLGSGIGIPYGPSDRPLDVEGLAGRAEELFSRFRRENPHTRILIEVGRYAVGKSGIYVTKVMDRKVSCGKTYLILKNTLNGFIRPSLARLVCSYGGAANGCPAPCEPLFTSGDAFEIRTLKEDGAEKETVTLVGNLCTAADVAAENVAMPRLDVGDVVIFTNAGSYGAVLSPAQFSSQERPAEVFLRGSGEVAVREMPVWWIPKENQIFEGILNGKRQ